MKLTDKEQITVEDANRILSRDYRQDVIGIVSAYADALGTDITDSESAYEWLHETVDGSQRVIYTFQAQQCLIYSDNDGAYAEEFGEEGIVTDGCIEWSRLAYAAFHADIVEALELYGLPYGYFDDIDMAVSDAEDEHDEKHEADDDPPEFDEDETRQKILEDIGEKANEEIKAGGWFD